jgi:hypothetical protein
VTGGKKFRPLLSTEPAEWDTEERGYLWPVALFLLGCFVGYIVWVFLWTYLG